MEQAQARGGVGPANPNLPATPGRSPVRERFGERLDQIRQTVNRNIRRVTGQSFEKTMDFPSRRNILWELAQPRNLLLLKGRRESLVKDQSKKPQALLREQPRKTIRVRVSK